MLELATLPVLIVDCQATLAAPRGHLLELGWAIGSGDPRARLVRLPPGERVPRAVARITGITDALLADARAADEAWRALLADGESIDVRPIPAVAHFARFERPFLERLGGPVLDLVCTHEIAQRLFPDLPRRSLRALAGYFGHAVGTMRRSTEHVVSTAFVWRSLIALLAERGVLTWPELAAWLAEPVSRAPRAKRGWPMPRDVRLAAPDRPGLYRMLRTNGDVLYVGKAASLKKRVNSYFRKQKGIHERTLEMLSQARGLSFEIAESPLEAALLEPDEIKRHRPPYNEALTIGDRAVWFASADLGERSPQPSARCSVGPFPSPMLLERFDALVQGSPSAVAPARWAPDERSFGEGVAALSAKHRELRGGLARRPFLTLGARLWREGRRLREDEGDDAHGGDAGPLFARTWTPAQIVSELEWLALQCAHAVRRARWLTALVESCIVFEEPGAEGPRLLVVSQGEIVRRASASENVPIPERGTRAERQAIFSIATFDRLRVLLTELKRLVAARHPVTLRLATRAVLGGDRLEHALAWI